MEKKLVTSKDLAQLVGVSGRRVGQLTEDGVIEKDGRGVYDLEKTVKAYIKYLSDKAYAREESMTEAELKEQKLRAEVALKESQKDLHELKTEIAKGQYVPVEEVELDYKKFFATFKKFAMAMPSRIAGLVGAHVEPVVLRDIEKKMNDETVRMLRAFVVSAVDNEAEDGDAK